LRKRGGTLYKACNAHGSFLKFEEAPSHILWEISTSSQPQVHEGGEQMDRSINKEGTARQASLKPARIEVIECSHQVPIRK